MVIGYLACYAYPRQLPLPNPLGLVGHTCRVGPTTNACRAFADNPRPTIGPVLSATLDARWRCLQRGGAVGGDGKTAATAAMLRVSGRWQADGSTPLHDRKICATDRLFGPGKRAERINNRTSWRRDSLRGRWRPGDALPRRSGFGRLAGTAVARWSPVLDAPVMGDGGDTPSP